MYEYLVSHSLLVHMVGIKTIQLLVFFLLRFMNYVQKLWAAVYYGES